MSFIPMKRFKKDSLPVAAAAAAVKHKPKDVAFQKLEEERVALKETLAKCTQSLDTTTRKVSLTHLRNLGHALVDGARAQDAPYGNCADMCGKFHVTLANLHLKACQLLVEKVQIPTKEFLTLAKEHSIKRREAVTAADWGKLEAARVNLAEKMCEYIDEYKDFFKRGAEAVQEFSDPATKLLASLSKLEQPDPVEPPVTERDIHSGSADHSVEPAFTTVVNAGTSHSLEKRKLITGQVYGRELLSLLLEHNTTIPPIVENLTTFIESADVIDTIGLFRIAGPTGKVQSLKEELDQGKEVDFAAQKNPHLACALLKAFLRSLPEPLIVASKFESFIDVSKEVIETKQVNQLRSLVESLPAHHAHLLDYIMAFCGRVAAHSEQNKMTAKNIASLIAPNILYRKGPSMTLLEDINNANTVVEILIVRYEDIFKNISYDKKSESGASDVTSSVADISPAMIDAQALLAIADAIISESSAADANEKLPDDKQDKRRNTFATRHQIVRRDPDTKLQPSSSDTAVHKHKINSNSDKSPTARTRAAQIHTMGSSKVADKRAEDGIQAEYVTTLTKEQKAVRRRSNSLGSPWTSLITTTDEGYNSDDQTTAKKSSSEKPRKASRNRLSSLAQLRFDNADEFNLAMEDIFNPLNYSGYVVVGYSKSGTLHLQAASKGSMEELLPALRDDEVQYCLVRLRIQEPQTSTTISTRDVFIQWNGPRVSNIQKGLKKSHVGEVKQIMQPFHAELVAVSKENFTQHVVVDRSSPLSGSHVID